MKERLKKVGCRFVRLILTCIMMAPAPSRAITGMWYCPCSAPEVMDLAAPFAYRGTNYLGDTDTRFAGCSIVRNAEEGRLFPDRTYVIDSCVFNNELTVLAGSDRAECRLWHLSENGWETIGGSLGLRSPDRGPWCVASFDGKVIVGSAVESPTLSCMSDPGGEMDYLGGYFPTRFQYSNDLTAVYDMVEWNSGLIVAGLFDRFSKGKWPSSDGDPRNSVEARGVAFWSGKQWSSFGEGVNGVVYSIAVDGTNVYVGGEFSQAGQIACENVARWDGSKWSRIGLRGIQGPVYKLAFWKGRLFATGLFERADNDVVNNIACLNAGKWEPLGGGVTSLPTNGIPFGRFLIGMENAIAVWGFFDRIDGRDVRTSGSAANWAMWRSADEESVKIERSNNSIKIAVLPDGCPYTIESNPILREDKWTTLLEACDDAGIGVEVRMEEKSQFFRIRPR